MQTLLSIVMRCRRGATAVEYGLIVSLIVITMLAGLRILGSQHAASWGYINNSVANAR